MSTKSPDYRQLALQAHQQWQGKLTINSKVTIKDRQALAVAYTPGVAEPCLAIQADEQAAYRYTAKHNLVAVITNGTAVLGLGDIGPSAAMPVMEGKCILFKEFGGVDAFPLCIDSHNTDEIVDTIYRLSKSFGGINLEDIAAPACFEIERRLKQRCDIPIFHDDQHGTAIVVGAAMLNALKLKQQSVNNLKATDLRIVINGAGAAGLAIARLLMELGFKQITLCDRNGVVFPNRPENNPDKETLVKDLSLLHPANPSANPSANPPISSLSDALVGADAFIGVSAANVVNQTMIRSMNNHPIVLAMANPTPEIMPDDAKKAGAYIVGTGRSDFPNQINNVLVFPGIFKGALSVQASDINAQMKLAAAKAIATIIPDEELTPDYIVPDIFNPAVAPAVAKAVANEAIRQKIARFQPASN